MMRLLMRHGCQFGLRTLQRNRVRDKNVVFLKEDICGTTWN